MLLEAEAKHWPIVLQERKNPREVKDTKHVYTCALGHFLCMDYVFAGTNLSGLPCKCGRKGTDLPKASADRQSAYHAFLDYIFQQPMSVFPTDQAIRQKAQKKAMIADLEAEGKTKEEIRAATKRKKQPQEQHFDDCGSDVGPIEEHAERALLALPGGSLDDAVAYSFFEDVEMGDLIGRIFVEASSSLITFFHLRSRKIVRLSRRSRRMRPS